MPDYPPFVVNDEENKQDFEADRRNKKKIHRRDYILYLCDSSEKSSRIVAFSRQGFEI